MMSILEKYLIDNWVKIEKNGKTPDKLFFIKLSGQKADTGLLNLILFVDEEKTPRFFIKINRSPEGISRIKEECNNLLRIKQMLPKSILESAPSVVFYGNLDDFTSAIVETFLKGKKIELNTFKELDKLYREGFSWLKDFFNVTNKGKIKINIIETRKKAKNLILSKKLGKNIEKDLDFICDESKDIDNTEIPLASSQGDFDFDNIVLNNNKLNIVDWEDYSEGRNPFLDAEFLIFNTAMYYHGTGEHIESFNKFFKKDSKTYSLSDYYITDYCTFLGLTKKHFYITFLNDVIDILERGYGKHHRIPFQNIDFFKILIKFLAREIV